MPKKIVSLFFLLLTPVIYCQETTQTPVAASLPAREARPSEIYPVSIEYPQEGVTLPAGIKTTAVFGAVSNPASSLTINGAPVKLYKNGAFLTTVPVSLGDFNIVAQVSDGVNTYTSVRKVKVDGIDVSKFADAQFDITTLSPQTDIWALSGDSVPLSAYGTPGAVVTATISDLKDAKEIVLPETEPGFYNAAYKITAEDKTKSSKIIYKIYNPQTKDKGKETAPGRLKILTDKDQVYAQVNALYAGTRMRTKAVPQGNLFPFYRLYGDLVITGLANGLYRVSLDENNTGWIEDAKISFTKKPAAPNKIQTVTAADQGIKTRIIFFSSKAVPVLTEGTPSSFNVTFFDTATDMPVIETPVSPLVNNIVFENAGNNTVKFYINYNDGQVLWGYDYAYDETGNLVLDLMYKPVLNPQPYKPLTGAKIMLDPGHSPRRKPPYDGAIGPTGFLEYEANMKTAKEVAELLSKTGAEVFLSKNEKEDLNLQGRIDRALKTGAQIFVSIHHNALPTSVDPFAKPRGFTIYYFNQHSKTLADNLNAAFAKNVKLPNNGTQTGDFYVVRAPQFPAVLTENAFLMFPDQEDMVRQDASRKAFVQAIYEGILSFYGYKPQDLLPPPLPKKPVKSKPVKSAKPAKITPKKAAHAPAKTAAPAQKPKPKADSPYAAPEETNPADFNGLNA
ncbi:MAG: N-acetylmuramoyl-L-alanine amidase [Elusimicrobium sp.]|nr:N-acetylmuramoyl-L-alanine amidase [Elusimicrobium sp.]